jgi:putative heme iron utilization protein
MESDAAAQLARLIRQQRVAALGTLRQGAPLVSMVSYRPEDDFSSFVLRVSRLAWHTQDMLQDSRVSLIIAETDDGRADPQTLARITLRGQAVQQPGEGDEFLRLKRAWLERFPESAVTFELADFSFWRIAPRDARYVAGLGRTYNLSAAALRDAAI